MAKYESWKMGKSDAPSPRVEKKWWSRLIKDTRRSNLDKLSRNPPRKARTWGEYMNRMDLKQTTRGYTRIPKTQQVRKWRMK